MEAKFNIGEQLVEWFKNWINSPEGKKVLESKMVKELYEKGYDEGLKEGLKECETTKAYQGGLEDAWECAKALVSCDAYGGLAMSEIKEIYGIEGYYNIFSILAELSAKEAVEKYQDYKLKKAKYEEEERKAEAEVKIGDEIRCYSSFYINMTKAVVCKIDALNRFHCIRWDGATFILEKEQYIKHGWLKTRRHFNQVTEMLKEMGEGQDD